VILKSPGLAPEVAMLLMLMAVVPLLVSVTDFGPPPPHVDTYPVKGGWTYWTAVPPVVAAAPSP